MTDAALAALIKHRTARMQPAMVRAWLRAIAVLRRSLNVDDVARLIEAGAIDAILSDAQIDRALIPFREEVRRVAEEGFTGERALLSSSGQQYGTPVFAFDVLNPRVRVALEQLEAQLLQRAKAEVREVVREAVLAGVEQGKNPTETARALRKVVGLSRSQARYVANAERELRAADAHYFTRQRRDRRFDATVRAALKKGEAVPEATIQKVVKRYAERLESLHTETVTRTATLNAYRSGQHESFRAAIAAGVIDAARAVKTWINVGDSKVRDEHLNATTGEPNRVGGETVPFDSLFSNGLPYPQEYNCRCVLRYWQRAA